MARFQSEEAYWDHVDDLYYADQESFDAHYADEIDGRIEPPVDDVPPATAITNAPGQLRLDFGIALR